MDIKKGHLSRQTGDTLVTNKQIQMQIYTILHKMQFSGANSAFPLRFSLRANALYQVSRDYLADDAMCKLILHTQCTVGLGLPAKGNAGDTTDDDIITQLTSDLTKYSSLVNRRTYTKCTNRLIADGVLHRIGYHGHKYIVNPYIFNRLNSKQCKHISLQLKLHSLEVVQ